MEYRMDLVPVASGTQRSWLQIQFMNLVTLNNDVGMKFDEMEEKILVLRREQLKLFSRHEKFLGACNILEFMCNILYSANEQLEGGKISRLGREWEKLIPNSDDPDDIVSQLIVRIQNITIKNDGNEEPQAAGSACVESQESQERKKSLHEELELVLKFAPSLSIFEDDLINQSRFLRMECNQLGERVKRTLGSLARIKLDLNKFENECHRMLYTLTNNCAAVSVLKMIEIEQMICYLQRIEKRNATLVSQWQEEHDNICAILDECRRFDQETNKVCDKMWSLCKCCKQLNTDRLELVYKNMGIKPQGSD